MTFKTFSLYPSVDTNFGVSNVTKGYELYDRGDYEHFSHGWHNAKGGHHGTKTGSAINALTLLAFLFFLNILQTCLRDNITGSQTPIVVVVTNETTTETNTTRLKRETDNIKKEDETIDSKEKLEIMTNVQDIIKQQINEMRNKKATQKNQNIIKFSAQLNQTNNKDDSNNKFITSNYKTTQSHNRQKRDNVQQSNIKQIKNSNEKNNKVRNDCSNENKIESKPDIEENIIYENESRSKNYKHKHDSPMIEFLIWNTLETFKPSLRASVEDSICCKLVACESSRISKKLGGHVKYFINNYFHKGLEWLCSVEQKPIRKAMKIGRKGKSCADEIHDCKPKNIITDIVLLLDYFIA